MFGNVGVRCEARTAKTAVPDPRTSWHREDGDVGHHRVPTGEAERRSRAGLRALQYRRRPAHREDTHHRAQGTAATLSGLANKKLVNISTARGHTQL